MSARFENGLWSQPVVAVEPEAGGAGVASVFLASGPGDDVTLVWTEWVEGPARRIHAATDTGDGWEGHHELSSAAFSFPVFDAVEADGVLTLVWEPDFGDALQLARLVGGEWSPVTTLEVYGDTRAVDLGAHADGTVELVLDKWLIGYDVSLATSLEVPEPALPAADVVGIGGNAEVSVSWSPALTQGWAEIEEYVVTAEPGGATCTTTGELTCTVDGLTNGVAYTFTVDASNAVGWTGPSAPSAPVTPELPPEPVDPPEPVEPVDPPDPVDQIDGLVSVVPARVWESRVGLSTVDGLFAGGGRLAAGGVARLAVGGRGGVPDGVSAVLLNVTAVSPLGAGFATVWPCGVDRPLASHVNFARGEAAAPNAVLSKVSDEGEVCVCM